VSLTVIGVGLGGLIVGAGGAYLLLRPRIRQVKAEKATLSAQLGVVADQLHQLQIQVTELQHQVRLTPSSGDPAGSAPVPLQPVVQHVPLAKPAQLDLSPPRDTPESLQSVPEANLPIVLKSVGTSTAVASSGVSGILPVAVVPPRPAIGVSTVVTPERDDPLGILMGDRNCVEVLPDLLAGLQHGDFLGRCDAASGLAAIAEGLRPLQLRTVVRALGVLVQDPDAQVRLAIVNALGEIRSSKALPYLKRALRDADGDVVKAASVALEPYRGAKRQLGRRRPSRQAKQGPR
jgi:hypothetical protein